nr:TATA-binding protein-associated factor 172-like [Penaeus vannamei]
MQDPVERINCQRKLVNQRLGLDVAEVIGVDTQNLFTNEDLTDSHQGGITSHNGQEKDAVVDIIRREMKSAGLPLSSREMNRARRKAKLLARQKSMDVSECTSDEGPEKKRMRLASSVTVDQAEATMRREWWLTKDLWECIQERRELSGP